MPETPNRLTITFGEGVTDKAACMGLAWPLVQEFCRQRDECPRSLKLHFADEQTATVYVSRKDRIVFSMSEK